jgi:hypothetical protein
MGNITAAENIIFVDTEQLTLKKPVNIYQTEFKDNFQMSAI